MSIGLSVFDLERFVMKFFVLLLVMFSIACSETNAAESGQKYELVCKHPIGHVVRYPVNSDTFWSPHANAAGIFRFETTDGRRVVSSFCHGESIR